jgi:hypothetical protein
MNRHALLVFLSGCSITPVSIVFLHFWQTAAVLLRRVADTRRRRVFVSSRSFVCMQILMTCDEIAPRAGSIRIRRI